MTTRIACVALLAALASGCGALRPIAYFLHPEQKREAEFQFPAASEVALVIDPAKPEYSNPVFDQALYDRISDYFREQKSDVRWIEPRETVNLKRQHGDFAGWSVQKIGRELGAKYVLYLRLDLLQSREAPGYPVLDPRVAMHAKVIAVERPSADARVWPAAEKEGREFSEARQAEEAGDASAEDQAMTKLAKDVGWKIASTFFEISLEDKPPKER